MGSGMELRPGVFKALFAKLAVQAQERAGAALEVTAHAVEVQAKVNASTGSHPYGTPTPASPGAGPASISNTLVNSISHTPPVPDGTGWVCRVGPQGGRYPTYTRPSGTQFTSKTPSSKYGLYLETRVDNRRGLYPWLKPALRHGGLVVAHITFAAAFSRPWL